MLLAGSVALFAFITSSSTAQLNVLESTIVDSTALNFSSGAASFSQNVNGRTYQRHPLATAHGYQYATYYDSNRNVCVGRRQLPSGPWEVIRFTGYSIPSNDSHNVVTIGLCALDGTIHLAFDHHVDPLNYRVSDLGVATNPESVAWSTSLFSSVTNRLGSAGALSSVTYPSFFNAPNGNLMLYYRNRGSGNGDGMIQEYDGAAHDWTAGLGKFIASSGSYTGAVSNNSTSRNPYINGISYGGNRLHASWGWRENSGGSQFNHDLNYAYSDDDGRTWHNSAGTEMGTTGSSFITVNSPGLIVASIPQNIGLSNQYTHYAYPDGSCHVIVAHNESGTNSRRYHHYWRNPGGTWSNVVLPFAGSRPKVVGDDDGCLFLAYTSGSVLRIAKGTPNAAMTSWTWERIHSQSDTTEGGEGLIDYSRWKSERILSVYGQEKAGDGGQPTPLHVFDYQVSAKAILPEPAHQEVDVVEPNLQWAAGIGAVSHRIYLGTDPVAVASATTGSPEYQGAQTGTEYTPASPLVEGITHYWRVDEIGAGLTVTKGLLWSFHTAITSPVYTLLSNASDASVREIPNVVDVDDPTTLLGTGGSRPWVDRCTVYVFQLPELGSAATPFSSASFTFEFADKQNTLQDNDLYGIARRVSPAVLSSDYYGQSPTPDPSAALLQTNILDNNTPFGLITTSASGRLALGDFLNAQYASGAGAGSFVFLRLNTAGPKDGIDRATLTMSEGGVMAPIDTRPRIDFTIAPSALSEWRTTHFGSPFESGDAADDADPNADGESNFLEFATGQNPIDPTRVAIAPAINGGNVELNYFRNADAMTDGLTFVVEWSDSLLPNTWSHAGVSETIASENAGLQEVIATVPIADGARRFVRLRVTRE